MHISVASILKDEVRSKTKEGDRIWMALKTGDAISDDFIAEKIKERVE